MLSDDAATTWRECACEELDLGPHAYQARTAPQSVRTAPTTTSITGRQTFERRRSPRWCKCRTVGATNRDNAHRPFAPFDGARDRKRARTSVSGAHAESGVVSATCGWCLGAHALRDCPWRPRLSLAAVLAFAATALLRPTREWQ